MSNYSTVSSDSSLLLSGGTPIVDPTFICYSSAKKTALSIPSAIVISGDSLSYDTTKALPTISNNYQVPSKAYIDT
jgi:hypothetical protein